MPHLAVTFLSFAVAFGLVRDERIALLIIVGMFMLLAMVRPLLGYVLVVLGAFSVQWLISLGLLPSSADLALDALALVLGFAIVMQLLKAGGSNGLPEGLKWLGAFVAVAVLSGLANASDMLAAVLGMRVYLRYIPLVLVPIVFAWDRDIVRGLIKLLIALLLLQVPVALIQFAVRVVKSGDVIGGTIGGMSSGVLTVVAIAASTLFAGFLIHRAFPVTWSLAALIGMCVPPALNETKIFFVAAPLVWAITVVPRVGRNVVGTLLVVAAVVAGFIGVYQSYTAVYGTALFRPGGVQQALNSQIYSDVGEGGVMNRIPQVVFAGQLISRDAGTLLFGYGPGSLARSDQADVEGLLIREYGSLLRNTVFLARIILEYGIAGLVCFWGFVLSAFRAGRRLERETDEPFWRAVGMGLQGTVLTLSVLSVYTGTFISDAPACMVWMLTGVAAVVLASGISDPTEDHVA